MKVWEKGKENKISTLWLESNSPALVAEYKLESTVQWTEIGSMNSIDDNLYTIPMTFINEGCFLVRVKDTNTGKYLIDKLEVQENTSNKDIIDEVFSLKEYIIDTNFKLSSLFKKWIKRGW